MISGYLRLDSFCTFQKKVNRKNFLQKTALIAGIISQSKGLKEQKLKL